MLRHHSGRIGWVRGLAFSGIIAAFSLLPAAAQKQAESKNMELVGENDLQGRSAYQPVIHKQGARWIAYIGHHGGLNLNPLTGKMESNGTSVVDVTDPEVGPITQVGTTIFLESTPGQVRGPQPPAGAHSEEILRSLGHDDAEIDGLRSRGVI